VEVYQPQKKDKSLCTRCGGAYAQYECELCWKERSEPPYEFQRPAQEMGQLIIDELMRGIGHKIGHLKLRDGDKIEVVLKVAHRQYSISKTIFLPEI
jgi:hypothetical protein